MPKFELKIYGPGNDLFVTTSGEYESVEDAVSKFVSSEWQAYYDADSNKPSVLINTKNVASVYIRKC